MRTYLILTTVIILNIHLSPAQDNNYPELWKKVENLENEGLTKSALEAVETIRKKASKEKNVNQKIKSLMYASKYTLILEEDAQLSIINNFKEEIANSKSPEKNIIESLLANLYWQYFQQNRWRFYNRTHTSEKVDANDFQTWDLQTIFNEIQAHFQNSLENAGLLKKEDLSKYDPLLLPAKNSKTFRPTLYDFLAHQALVFYKTTENNITKPAYKFEIDNPDLLCEARQFTRLNLQSKDSTSLQLTALKVYQSLIDFHLKDKEPYALADVDIERLKFIYQHAVFPEKAEKFLIALQDSKSIYKDHEVTGLYDFEIASLYNLQANEYVPETKTENQWKRKEALEICERVISTYPNSVGAEKCKALKHEITRQDVSLTSEQYLPVNQPSKILVRYRNLGELNLKSFKLSRDQFLRFSKLDREEERFNFIKNLDPEKVWKSPLKNENDYQSHTTEILLPQLSNGYHLILSLPDADNEKTYSYNTIQVTNLALIDKSDGNKHIFQLINRNNGKPLSGANISLSYKHTYDGKILTKHFTTNSDGAIELSSGERYYDVNAQINFKGENAYFGPYYVYSRTVGEHKSNQVFVFTDRSIYRPGQTVFFKGIAIKQAGSKSEILTNTIVSASLKDVNGQNVKTQEFKTNEYGSFQGEFILPEGGLTGYFNIEVTSKQVNLHGNASFSVEEYKRPKFETNFKPVTETYKVNDSITVKGTASAYAGSNITDAKVVYRVHRQVQYPIWFYWRRPYFSSEPMEIAHGETTTNAKGEYEITFKAIPDNSVNKENLPIFHYEVTADVTDINGETRSTTTVVNVGYHALTANVYIHNKIDKAKDDHKLTISTQNLNGQFVPAQGTIKIYKLQAPDRVYRERPWEAPDYEGFTESEFAELFPYEAYGSVSDFKTWEKGELVFEEKFDTDEKREPGVLGSQISLGNIQKWESGKYVVELETKDKFGQEVKDIQHTELFSENDTTTADNQLFSVKIDKDSYKTGENVVLKACSAAKGMTVTIDVEKNHKIVSTHTIDLKDNCKEIKIPVKAEDLGGFAIKYSYAYHNSFKSGIINVSVPYPASHLQIETVTFRDKLKPGVDETWSFKIKGPKGDKVAAEMLASMYDASLDQFMHHSWNFNPIYRPTYNSYNSINGNNSFGTRGFNHYDNTNKYHSYPTQYYDQLNWFGFYFANTYHLYKSTARREVNSPAPVVAEEAEMSEMVMQSADGAPLARAKKEKDTAGNVPPPPPGGSDSGDEDFDGVAVRKNLQETAFFFPQLTTDAEGNISFSFTTPEALTEWKLQLLAHTKTLESGTQSLTTVTQKELMVVPNAPRFLRQGDQITISSKISNLTEKSLSGQAVLKLSDAVSGNDITEKLLKAEGRTNFTVDAEGNTNVSWTLQIPDDVQAVQYQVIAKAGDFSDGEQNALPVLSNRMLVTETMPMWIRSDQTKTFTLDKLKNNASTTLKHHQLTLEMTSNPAWYAVQALPYLMEYPYECNEQIFSRYYANKLASHIANSNPRIKEVFNQWKNTDALLSNLEKNQELKSLLIEETPWLRDAQSETEQKKRIGLLFDLNKMSNELANSKRKLIQSQMNNGAWAWFNGGHPSRYITQHIITGFGHLNHLNVEEFDGETQQMIHKAIQYLDAEFVKEYEWMKDHTTNLDDDHLTYSQIHYLYMRSFYKEIPLSAEVREITAYYAGQTRKYWLNKSLYAKGMLSLIMYRMNDKETAGKITRSLKENSITSDELGMYWKENKPSWFWYQAPIETQALMIEAFSEIEGDVKTIDNLKIWLLKNKQTNSWESTKATTEAVYALLLQGSDWLSVTDMVDIKVGNKTIDPAKMEDVKVEAGTGYFKTSWTGNEITSEMADVTIAKKGEGIAWGGLYWQYFEDLDKITHAETPLKLSKKLFLKKNTDKGEEITAITGKTTLKVGDLIRVRIELRVDREMEYVHMKDMRASGLEPVNVLSLYKWQDGLGYYESTKDASTNFFFNTLPKGVYVFEYDLRVNNAGDFSNGITTIQCMYAPEFTSHSEGVRIQVKE